MAKAKVISANKLEVIRAEGFHYVHSNQATLTQSAYDVSIVFSAIVPGPNRLSGGLPLIEDRVAVSMAWEHAKALGRLLLQNAEEYEKQFGAKIRDTSTFESVSRRSATDEPAPKP